MSAQAEVPIGTPMRDAWERYKLTEDYANTKRWAAYPEHLDGSLWAAFVVGWNIVDDPEVVAQVTTTEITRLAADLAAAREQIERLSIAIVDWRTAEWEGKATERQLRLMIDAIVARAQSALTSDEPPKEQP